MSGDEKEHHLQQRIADKPALLPGLDGPFAVAREIPLRGAGHPDVVVVDATGQIAIVECKRASNPECRRWVIGQVFEYAAGLWKMEYEDFERLLAASGTDLTAAFRDPEWKGRAGWDEQRFCDDVTRNLESGDFRLFIAVDEMTAKLKKRLNRTVTFLNSQLPQVQVVAVPRNGSVNIYGNDPDAIPRPEPKFKPDRWTLLEEISSPIAGAVAGDLFSWADEMKSRGIEVQCTSTQCVVKTPGGPLFRIRPQEVQVALSAAIARRGPSDERITALVQQLDEIGVRLKNKRPRAPLELLADDRVGARFLALMEQHFEVLAD